MRRGRGTSSQCKSNLLLFEEQTFFASSSKNKWKKRDNSDKRRNSDISSDSQFQELSSLDSWEWDSRDMWFSLFHWFLNYFISFPFVSVINSLSSPHFRPIPDQNRRCFLHEMRCSKPGLEVLENMRKIIPNQTVSDACLCNILRWGRESWPWKGERRCILYSQLRWTSLDGSFRLQSIWLAADNLFGMDFKRIYRDAILPSLASFLYLFSQRSLSAGQK